MSERPSIAVVGCGYWGPNLIRNFRGLADCQMARVCDVSEDRLSHMQQLFPEIVTTTDFEDVLGPEIDAVAIATPIRTHHSLALRCLEAGKHVFVEKPLAASVAECEELLAAAKSRGLTLMVGHTFVFTPAVQYMKEAIDKGVLGEVYSISSSRLNLGLFQKDINVTWDLAPHDLSIILHVLNEMPQSVNCQGMAHVNNDLEDVTSLSLTFASGVFVNIRSSWLDPNKVRRMVVAGSKRMLMYDDIKAMEKIKIYDKGVEVPPHYDTFAEFHYSYHYGDMRAPFIRQLEPLKVECQEFLDCMRTGEKSRSSGEEGLQVVRILEAASESLRNGGDRIELSAKP